MLTGRTQVAQRHIKCRNTTEVSCSLIHYEQLYKILYLQKAEHSPHDVPCRWTFCHVTEDHSLTAALDQLRVVASSTSNDPGQRSRQHQADRPMSSYTCCSQCLRRPGGRFQSAAGGVLVWASIGSCSACKAAVFSGRRQMWPNNEWRTVCLVVSFSHWLLRWIPCHTIWYTKDTTQWKDWILSLSTLRIVHISEPYNTTDCTREVYILSLVERLTPNVVKLIHNGTSNAQASVYLWVGVAIGVCQSPSM